MSGTAPDFGDADDVAGSVIAGLDPRTRLLVTVAFVVGILTLKTPLALVVALAVALGLVALARLPLAAARHRLMHVEGFMLVLLVLLPFTMPGAPIFAVGPVSMSEEGLARAISIALKVNAAVLATFALLGSMEPVRLGRAAGRLGVPLELVHLFLFVVRYAGVFEAETTRLREAMRARAFVARSNLHTWRTFGNLAGLMLVRSLDRAERVEEAMRCRGYVGRLPMVPASAMTRSDFAFAAAAVCLIAGVVVADRFA